MATATDFGDYLLKAGKVNQKIYNKKLEMAKIIFNQDREDREKGGVPIIMPSYNTAPYIKEAVHSIY